MWAAGIKIFATPIRLFDIVGHLQGCFCQSESLFLKVIQSLCFGCIVSSAILVCPGNELNWYAFVPAELNLLHAC